MRPSTFERFLPLSGVLAAITLAAARIRPTNPTTSMLNV
jgi:hypothetical protein